MTAKTPRWAVRILTIVVPTILLLASAPSGVKDRIVLTATPSVIVSFGPDGAESRQLAESERSEVRISLRDRKLFWET